MPRSSTRPRCGGAPSAQYGVHAPGAGAFGSEVGHAAEPDVGRRTVLRLRRPRGRPVTVAVLRCAEVRTTLQRLVDARIRFPRGRAAGLGSAPARRSSSPVAALLPAGAASNTSSSSTPTRCRSCRPDRSRSAGRRRPATCRPSPWRRRCGTGIGPARCWPSARRPARLRHPTHRSSSRRRARRTPTRLRWAVAAPPSARTPRRRRMTPARRDGRGGPRPSCPDRTADATTRAAPSPTTAASPAGRRAPRSAGRPARRARGPRLRPPGTAPDRADARPP